MSTSRNAEKPPWLLLLALVAFVLGSVAWWWAAHLSPAQALTGPAILGLLGTSAALAAALLMWFQKSSASDSSRKSERQARSPPKAVDLTPKRETLQAHQLLASTLDTMDVGLEIWDAQDRLVMYNNKINLLNTGFSHTPGHIGQTFESLMRANLDQHLILEAVGHEEAWLAQRLATRGAHKQPLLQEIAGNQWINTYETRTPEGYLATTLVDVTDLVRKGKALEARNKQLTQQSATDELTGLANRRRFYQSLTTEWQRAARSITPLSLLMVDIDHFKSYNDCYGHPAGDECLRQVAAVLGQCVRRAGELVARYGGEEFVVLLPGSDLSRACETAQKCLDRMRQASLPHSTSPVSPYVTLSIGVACLLPDPSLDPAAMVNAADAAMYRAKTAGRARFEIADQADWDIDKDTPRTRPSPLS
jgi:diguanylate cyclase (GGDEF)-like protein